MGALVPLGQIAGNAGLIIDGDWVESKDQDPDGEVRLVQLADIGVGSFLDKSNRYMTAEKAVKLKCTYLEEGDILVARMPDPLGRACQFPGDQRRCVTVVDVCILRPDATVADAAYVTHILNSDGVRRQLEKYIKGTTRQRISRTNLEQIRIPLPPLPEQRRIAAILDQADALRAKRREALAQLDSLTQSLLSELLDNSKSLSKVPFEKLVLDMHQGINTVTESIEYKPTGFPIIQSKHTTQGYLDLNDARFVDAQTFEKYREKYKPRKSDLLLCNIGTIGSSIIVKEEIDFLVAWNLFLIKVKEDVAEPVYIKAFLDRLFNTHYFDKYLTGGTVKFISKKTLSETLISLPPIEEQRGFVGLIDGLERFKCSQLNALSQLDALFASLQHRAFQGAL